MEGVLLAELGQLAQAALPDEARVVDEARRVVALGAEAALARDGEYGRLVARRHRHHRARHLQPLRGAEVLGLAEVDQADAAVAQQHDVARVRVRGEEAVAQHLTMASGWGWGWGWDWGLGLGAGCSLVGRA